MFVDPLAALIPAIRDAVGGVEVASRVPDGRVLPFVQVRRVGGTADVPVRESVRLDVIVWAASEPEAAELGSTVRAFLWGLAGRETNGLLIYRLWEFTGPRFNDDDKTESARWWVTVEMIVRADPVVPASAI